MGENGEKRKKIIIIVIIIGICLGALIIYLNYYFSIEPEEFNVIYYYRVDIILDGNISEVYLEIPIAHNQNITSTINPKYNDVKNTDYGKVLKIKTDRQISFDSYFDDNNKIIDPDLSFSTQEDQYVYLFLQKTNDETSVSIRIYLDRSYHQRSGPIFGSISTTFYDYIVIGDEPFIAKNDKFSDLNIAKIIPYQLAEGWNKIEIQKGQYSIGN
jgi:hypothetical protein